MDDKDIAFYREEIEKAKVETKYVIGLNSPWYFLSNVLNAYEEQQAEIERLEEENAALTDAIEECGIDASEILEALNKGDSDEN